MNLGERLNRIHEDALAGEPIASLHLFREALGPLSSLIRRRYPKLDAECAHDIATDAILLYLDRPTRCDPTKGSLWALLCEIATKDALDAVRRDRRREAKREAVEQHVELWGSASNDKERMEHAMDARRIMETYGGRLVKRPEDEQLLSLILEQEKSTTKFAEALGLDPSAAGTERMVKQAKDRMLLRLKRLRDEF